MRDGQPPFIGAAEDMSNIFLVSDLFKRSGAFYIKRKGTKFPKIYRTMLSEFIKTVLENETNIEFFIEATRSRTGQILYPKYGFLKYVIESYIEKRVPNALLVPINVTYENIMESDSYIVEHRGGQKVKEDTMRLLKSFRSVTKRYGKIVVKSAEPISLKNYIKNSKVYNSQKGSGSLDQDGTKNKLVQELGLHVCDVLQKESIFMTTHLVCAVLLMR